MLRAVSFRIEAHADVGWVANCPEESGRALTRCLLVCARTEQRPCIRIALPGNTPRAAHQRPGLEGNAYWEFNHHSRFREVEGQNPG